MMVVALLVLGLPVALAALLVLVLGLVAGQDSPSR
jgi:hypothetical protein